MKKIFIVEAVSMFRMRYAVVAECAEHACDEVVMNHDGHLKELSQIHLDEIITSTREVSKEEYLKVFDADNDYLASWTEEQKMNQLNKIDYTD